MNTRAISRAALPLSSTTGRGGGSRLSAWLAALGLVWLSSPALALTDQLQQAVSDYLGQRINAEAERRGWQQLTHQLHITPLTDTTGMAACSQPLQVSQVSGQASVLERLRLEVNCPGGWTLLVSTQQHLFLPVLVTNAPIDRGQPLQADMLKHERVNISRAGRGFITDFSEIDGQRARRRLRADQVLTPAMLEASAAVNRGQQVRILARHGGIQASTLGQALADGQPGEIIRVRNLSSDKVIDAQIIGPGEVDSTWQ